MSEEGKSDLICDLCGEDHRQLNKKKRRALVIHCSACGHDHELFGDCIPLIMTMPDAIKILEEAVQGAREFRKSLGDTKKFKPKITFVSDGKEYTVQVFGGYKK